MAQKLYSPQILYANSFQEMTRGIRSILSPTAKQETLPITTQYRKNRLRGEVLFSTREVSTFLKGANFSPNQIQDRMNELDEEFRKLLEVHDAETYVRGCTDLMMKFISLHPFDDGNGRTSRMLLQAMLGRRGVSLPSTIDNYFDREHDTDYSRMEYRCLQTDDYSKMEEHILKRVREYNGEELVLNDENIFPEEILATISRKRSYC